LSSAALGAGRGGARWTRRRARDAKRARREECRRTRDRRDRRARAGEGSTRIVESQLGDARDGRVAKRERERERTND